MYAELAEVCKTLLSWVKHQDFRESPTHKRQESHPAMTDLSRHVDLLNCVKLPRVLASLSRHSNCYVALQLLLAARLAGVKESALHLVLQTQVNYPN